MYTKVSLSLGHRRVGVQAAYHLLFGVLVDTRHVGIRAGVQGRHDSRWGRSIHDGTADDLHASKEQLVHACN